MGVGGMWVWMRECAYVCVCMCADVCKCVQMCANVCRCVWMRVVGVCGRVSANVCIQIYVDVFVCMCYYVDVQTCVCIFVNIVRCV